MYLTIIIVFLLISFAISSISDYLNAKNLTDTLPEEFVGYYNEEKYKNSQNYLKDRTKFSFVSSITSLIISIIFILIGAIAGFKAGFFRKTVDFVGMIIVIVLSFYLKNYVSYFMYTFLPFFNFSGAFSGLEVINILQNLKEVLKVKWLKRKLVI